MTNLENKPSWWNPSGAKNHIVPANIGRKKITITNGPSHLIIEKPGDKNPLYTVRWIVYGKGGVGRTEVKGYRLFKREELFAAFGIPCDSHPTDAKFSMEYDADVGIPGLFIRRGLFLNVPCPGTGLDGDPNISIYINGSIHRALCGFC